MPFMRGLSPIRRTLEHLQKPNLILRPYIRIISCNYNDEGENHKGARDFVFWHLPQLQYKNPEVQVITFNNYTPTPFIRSFLNNGKEILMDVDWHSKAEIFDRVIKTLCKTEEELEADRVRSEVKENPAHFGYLCERHCICEIPGQVPCPSLVNLPYTWRGKYKWSGHELDESKYL